MYLIDLFFTEHYTAYAFSLISEYLPIVIQKSLLKHLQLPEEVVCKKRKAGSNITDVNKKVKFSDSHSDENTYKVEKVNLLLKVMFYYSLDLILNICLLHKVVTPKMSAKDKALKKAAVGTKSISSIFKKK